MAYLDKRSGEIVLEQDDKEMFKEVGSHFTPQGYRHSKWVTDIIKWLNGEKTND